MTRLFALLALAALCSLSFAVGTSEQERIAFLEQENRELKSQLEQLQRKNGLVQSRSALQLRDDLTKDEACKCHYCEDDYINSGACTECDGYCDICDFCESSPPLMSTTNCAAQGCTGGFDDSDPPLPAPTPNQAEVCEPYYSLTSGTDTAINTVNWRYNAFDYGASATAKLVSVKTMFATTSDNSVVVPARGALWKSTSPTATKPDTFVQAFTKVNTQTTTKKWYTFTPEGKNSVTLTPGTRYFWVFAHQYTSGTVSMTYWMYPNTIPIKTPTGVTIVQGRWYTPPQNKGVENLNEYNSVSFASVTSKATNYAWIPEFAEAS